MGHNSTADDDRFRGHSPVAYDDIGHMAGVHGISAGVAG